MIAESIIGATSELDIRVPMVVRLQGTNSEQGLQMVRRWTTLKNLNSTDNLVCSLRKRISAWWLSLTLAKRRGEL